MMGVIERLKKLEADDLDLGTFVERYVSILDSYLSRFTQEERPKEYQNLMAELKKTPMSEMAKAAFVYVD